MTANTKRIPNVDGVDSSDPIKIAFRDMSSLPISNLIAAQSEDLIIFRSEFQIRLWDARYHHVRIWQRQECDCVSIYFSLEIVNPLKGQTILHLKGQVLVFSEMKFLENYQYFVNIARWKVSKTWKYLDWCLLCSVQYCDRVYKLEHTRNCFSYFKSKLFSSYTWN